MFKPLLFRLMAIAAMVLLAGCGEPPSESEQLQELQTGLVYRSYSGISASGVPTLIEQYNNQLGQEQGLPFTAGDMHAVLAVLWGISAKPALALAEADLARQTDIAGHNQVLIDSAAAVALYQQGWPGLAHAMAERPRLAVAEPERLAEVNNEQLGLFVVLAYLGFVEKDEAMTNYAFDGLATISEITWLPTLGKAGIKIQQGELQDGVIILKQLLNDPSLPAQERAQLQALIADLEKDYGKVESPMFMPRLVMARVLPLVLNGAKEGAAALLNEGQKFIAEVKLPGLG